MKKINTPYTKVGRLKSTELLIESANNTELSGIYYRQPDPNTRLEDKIFPYSEKLQKIYEKICKNGNLSLNLLNELKQYANDTRRNIKGFPGLMRINDRTLVASALLRRKACLTRKAAYSVQFGSPEWYRRYREQQQDLIEYAKLENFWYQSQEDFVSKKGLYLSDKQGTESKIYCDKHKEFVYKFLGLNTNCNFLYDCLIERIVVHNYMFGDKTPLDIVGFCQNNSSVNVIVKQPQVDSEIFATDDQIKELLKTFEDFNPHNKYALRSNDIFVYDLHNKNVLVKDGEYYVVDCYAKFYRQDDVQNKYMDKLGASHLSGTTHKYSGIYYIPDVEHEGDIDWGKNKITNAGGIIDDIYSERKDEPIDDYYEGRNWYILWHCNTEKDYMNVLRVTDFYSYNSIMRNQLFSNEILLLKQKYKPTKNR